MEQKPGDRPIRVRGVYRASKRGQEWAIKLLKKGRTFYGMLDWLYYRVDFEDIFNKKNTYFDLIKSDKGFMGCYLPIPIKLGKCGVRKRSFHRFEKRNKP